MNQLLQTSGVLATDRFTTDRFATDLVASDLVAQATGTGDATVGAGQLVFAAVAGIFSIIILIVWLKMHPFLALMLGSGLLAVLAGIPFLDMFTSFSTGLGSTVGGVGVLIALGAIIGALLVKSGASDSIVDGFLAHTPVKWLPWTMAALAFIIGIPLFFEVGVVLLIPVVMIVAQRTKKPIILLGIPALAGLSVLHALVPPHPGPLITFSRRAPSPESPQFVPGGAGGCSDSPHFVREQQPPRSPEQQVSKNPLKMGRQTEVIQKLARTN